MSSKTPRQQQDFVNGYSHGYHEARHGETSVDGRAPSEEYAAGCTAGLRDGRTSGPGRSWRNDLRAALERHGYGDLAIDADGRVMP